MLYFNWKKMMLLYGDILKWNNAITLQEKENEVDLFTDICCYFNYLRARKENF